MAYGPSLAKRPSMQIKARPALTALPGKLANQAEETILQAVPHDAGTVP